ncbi:Alpha/Beta hydrolase fold [Sesbania bispinosa]|nr:Alpha/Beta hydrolase fold [Sesbania bispinosa]
MASTDVVHEFPQLFRLYKDGHVERFLGVETVPSGTDSLTGVQSKDVTINPQTGLSARLYLPPTAASSSQKLPLLIYIHGGAFCVCSPANPAYHSHLNTVSAEANVVVVSVDYRLAPEHPLPSPTTTPGRPFNGPQALPRRGSRTTPISESCSSPETAPERIWHIMWRYEERDELVAFLYPTYGGVDDLKIHAQKDPKLSDLGCPKVLVFVAGMDLLKERGKSYYEALKKSGWSGSVELVETEGENHVFHLFDPTKENSAAIVKQFVSFMKQVEKDVRA